MPKNDKRGSSTDNTEIVLAGLRAAKKKAEEKGIAIPPETVKRVIESVRGRPKPKSIERVRREQLEKDPWGFDVGDLIKEGFLTEGIVTRCMALADIDDRSELLARIGQRLKGQSLLEALDRMEHARVVTHSEVDKRYFSKGKFRAKEESAQQDIYIVVHEIADALIDQNIAEAITPADDSITENARIKDSDGKPLPVEELVGSIAAGTISRGGSILQRRDFCTIALNMGSYARNLVDLPNDFEGFLREKGISLRSACLIDSRGKPYFSQSLLAYISDYSHAAGLLIGVLNVNIGLGIRDLMHVKFAEASPFTHFSEKLDVKMEMPFEKQFDLFFKWKKEWGAFIEKRAQNREKSLFERRSVMARLEQKSARERERQAALAALKQAGILRNEFRELLQELIINYGEKQRVDEALKDINQKGLFARWFDGETRNSIKACKQRNEDLETTQKSVMESLQSEKFQKFFADKNINIRDLDSMIAFAAQELL